MCVVDEHTDVDDGRRLGVSGVERVAGHARRISRRVGVWVVGKRKKTVRCRVSEKTGKTFLTAVGC